MSFPDLRSFLHRLEARGLLARIKAEVNPDQEVTVIQHRVLAQQGPALLFENLKDSPYRLVSNLFGSRERVEMVFGRAPAEVGEKIAALAAKLTPPTLSGLWQARSGLREVFRARLRTVASGPILENTFAPPRLNRLPVLTCWPKDGGPFFTLPLVHTVDPVSGQGNLGIYRLQLFDDDATGMHWQIEKGGAFHFHRAREQGQPLPVSVILGGPPALTIAAVAPLPEGFDERLLAAFMMGSPLEVISRPVTGHRIPAQAEFVLEGSVGTDDRRREGPFGDHLGHYSKCADFPVFRVDRLLARQDAIYPATVVGKPVQEDYHIGVALQEMARPLLKMLKPAVTDLWAYPETGFHPLAVMSVRERYPREALKHALGMLGEGQLSLTKVMIVVDQDVPVRDIRQVSQALWERLDPAEGLHLLAPTAQDTLDFTGPQPNTGSRLILVATRRDGRPLRAEPPPPPPFGANMPEAIIDMKALGAAFLVVQVKDKCDITAVREALAAHPAARRYLFQVLVSADVPLADDMLVLWGWFTRFDPLTDLHPAQRIQAGNRLIMRFPICIDATWKQGYPEPLRFDPDAEKRVNARWGEYGIPVE